MRHTACPIALIVALSMGPAAQAATFILRAADQSDLSRVSINLGARDFAFEQVGARQFDLVLAEPGHDFDTVQIFPDRLASRVISARQMRGSQESRLRLVVNCDCVGNLRKAQGIAIIEFRDRQALLPAKEAIEAPPNTETPEAYSGKRSAQAPQFSPQPIARPGGEPEPPHPHPTDQAIHAQNRPAPPNSETEIARARQRLLQQLTRAAEQGLLSFDADGPMSAPPVELSPADQTEPVTAHIVPQESDDSPTAQTIAVAAPLKLPVREEAATDTAFAPDRGEPLVSADPCESDRYLAEIQWPDSKDPAADIASLRGRLLSKSDLPYPGLVSELAILYISLGLGVEARQVLATHGDDSDEVGLLMDLARIVDGVVPDSTAALSSNGACSGNTALWLAAARQRGLSLSQMPSTKEEMLAAFALIPARLRHILGPAVLSHFLDESDLGMARRVDQLLQRSPGESATAYDLAMARLTALNGNHDAAEAIYNRIALSRGAKANEALLLLIDSMLGRGAVVPEDLIQRVQAASYVERTGPLGRDLKLAEIKARAGSGDLPAVLDELARLIARNPHQAAELRDTVHALLEESDAATIGAFTYARSVIGNAELISTRTSGDRARTSVAEQLTGIGLANEALKILAPAMARGGDDVRRAAARAFLVLDDPNKALRELRDLETEDADALRIAAYRQSGDAETALELLTQTKTGDVALASDLAWLAGDWRRATNAGPAARRLLAAYMTRNPSAAESGLDDRARVFLPRSDPTNDITLNGSADALERSKAVRAVIEEALSNG